LKDYSWPQLETLHEQLKAEHEELASNDASQLDPPEHWLEKPEPLKEAELIESLDECEKITEAKQPGEKKGAPKSPPKGYPSSRSQYADPKNYKYPLDTEKHVRAALGYFSKPANRSKGGYTPEEQKFMWRRIIRAAKKYDIELSPDVKKRAEKLLAMEAGDDDDRDEDDKGGEKEMEEQQLMALVEAKVKELLGSDAKAKEQGEAYQVSQRNPTPDQVKQMCDEFEAFKAKHGEFEKKIGAMEALAATYPLSAMEKRLAAMEAKFKAMEDEAAQGDDDDDDDGDKAKEKKAKEQTGAEETAEKGKDKDKKKAKEAAAQGQVAAGEMLQDGAGGPPGTGTPPGEEASPEDDFGSIMERASRETRGS
jgi:hypothetical protein